MRILRLGIDGDQAFLSGEPMQRIGENQPVAGLNRHRLPGRRHDARAERAVRDERRIADDDQARRLFTAPFDGVRKIERTFGILALVKLGILILDRIKICFAPAQIACREKRRDGVT